MVGNLLQLHPCIEIIEGKLIAGKKYRGKLSKVAPALLKEFTAKHNLQKDHIYFINTPYMDEDVRKALNEEAKAMGYERSPGSRSAASSPATVAPAPLALLVLLLNNKNLL